MALMAPGSGPPFRFAVYIQYIHMSLSIVCTYWTTRGRDGMKYTLKLYYTPILYGTIHSHTAVESAVGPRVRELLTVCAVHVDPWVSRAYSAWYHNIQ